MKLSSASEIGSAESNARPPDDKTSPSVRGNSYPVVIKILYGLKIHSALLKLRENTKSSIEKQAKDYICAKYQQDTSLRHVWTSQLLSVIVKEQETDVSGYGDNDLTFLLRIISQHNLSQFTVKVGCSTA